ncbi:MAG: D-alanyl-D-alanine carboxypeptidase family protein [Candidatus Comchoanobacterales bacterium]
MKKLLIALTLIVSIAHANTIQFDDTIIPSAPKLKADAYILMNAVNGDVISEKNSHKVHAPASLTKLMTLYIIENMVAQGKIKLTDEVNITEESYQAEGSSMFLELNSRVTIDELINGVIVASGNDAALALAIHAAGSIDAFVDMMNQMAEQWDLENTHFQNPTGIPHSKHYSTAYDLAKIAQHIIYDHPEFYQRYQKLEMKHNNITQSNRNHLLKKLSYVDGLKTGHTKEAGYCLVSSGIQNGMRLIAITLGSPTDHFRDVDNEKLLTYGFRFFENITLLDDESINIPVWNGTSDHVALKTYKPLNITIPQGNQKDLTIISSHPTSLTAPHNAGEQHGSIKVYFKNQLLASESLFTQTETDETHIFGKISSQIKRIFS